MTTSWTPSRDKRLLAQQAAGRTAAQIAKTLGVTRNAVIGRSRRLRGIVYQSDIDSWTRANAQRAEEARKRAQVRRVAQRKALRAAPHLRSFSGFLRPLRVRARPAVDIGLVDDPAQTS